MKSKIAAVLILVVIIAGVLHLLRHDNDGQPSKNVPNVAILTYGPFPLLDMILDELKLELGKSDSPKVQFRVFNANFQQELLRKSAREMVSGPFDVLVSLSTPATQVVVAENMGRKPVVFSFVSTPSEVGWKGPGSLPNVTGFVDTVPLKENLAIIRKLCEPGITIGYVVNDGEAPAKKTYEEMLKIAGESGFSIKKIPVGAQSDVRASVMPVRDRVRCFFIGPDSVATSAADLLVGLAAERKQPVFCTDKVSVGRGCLACVAPDYGGLGRRTAGYVLKIIEGTPAGQLPVTDFTDYLTYVNSKTLKMLDIKLPEGMEQSVTLVGGGESEHK